MFITSNLTLDPMPLDPMPVPPPPSVVTDDSDPRNLRKYPLADYALTPSAAVVDSHLVLGMPKGLTAAGGLDALTHALESYVSVYSTEYTKGLSLQVGQPRAGDTWVWVRDTCGWS